MYYAHSDGSSIVEVVSPLLAPNGVGLSPDGTVLYVAETDTARLWAFDLIAPGQIHRHLHTSPHVGRLVHGMGGYRRFDSLAVQANGDICVATLVEGCITTFAPDGRLVSQFHTGDHHTTNICFGGTDGRTAFITLADSGQLISTEWPQPGLALNFGREPRLLEPRRTAFARKK